MASIPEPARDVPVVHEADICVVGGSCTGVFAAVRAARLGARVALVECNGFFGGVATAGLVSIWHSLLDDRDEKPVIGGLTAEVLERLSVRDAARQGDARHCAHFLNTEELKIELDELIAGAGVRAFLHARFAAPILDALGRAGGVVLEDKSGRRAIRARYLVDASGDGDLIHRMGLPTRTPDDLQPPTTCAVFEGLRKLAAANPGFDLAAAVFNEEYPEALNRGFLWSAPVVGAADLTMVAGTRVNHADTSDADQLTRAEFEGRRQVRAMMDVLRRHVKGGRDVGLRNLPSTLGIRETRHAVCLHTLTEREVLEGRRFADAIANGTYRVDVHHSAKPGLTFRYLDGREEYVVPGRPVVRSRWLEEGRPGVPFYQVPYRSLVPQGSHNVIAAGRLVDCDRGAYGGVRVMVNTNQTGEAAGVACALALEDGRGVADVPADRLREALRWGGSVVL